MSMGTIGKAMKATRTQMIEDQAEVLAEKFTRHFGLRDGDYIRYSRGGSAMKQGRILSVESVFWNQAGGVTAIITVVPLLVDGKLGKSRNLFMTVNANGSGLRGLVATDVIERVSPRRDI